MKINSAHNSSRFNDLVRERSTDASNNGAAYCIAIVNKQPCSGFEENVSLASKVIDITDIRPGNGKHTKQTAQDMIWHESFWFVRGSFMENVSYVDLVGN